MLLLINHQHPNACFLDLDCSPLFTVNLHHSWPMFARLNQVSKLLLKYKNLYKVIWSNSNNILFLLEQGQTYWNWKGNICPSTGEIILDRESLSLWTKKTWYVLIFSSNLWYILSGHTKRVRAIRHIGWCHCTCVCHLLLVLITRVNTLYAYSCAYAYACVIRINQALDFVEIIDPATVLFSLGECWSARDARVLASQMCSLANRFCWRCRVIQRAWSVWPRESVERVSYVSIMLKRRFQLQLKEGRWN